MNIEDYKKNQELMEKLLQNINKANIEYAQNCQLYSYEGIKIQKEKIAKLTFLYNSLIGKNDKNRRTSLYSPGPQSPEEIKKLMELIDSD